MGRCPTGHKMSDNLLVLHGVFSLSLDAFIIIGESSKPMPMGNGSIHYDVTVPAAVLQLSKLVRCQETSASKVSLMPHYSIKFDRVAARLVHLQSHLVCADNYVRLALRAAFGMSQR